VTQVHRPASAGPSTDAAAQGSPLSILAADGVAFAGHWHTGRAGSAARRGTIVLAPATGVPQGFYLRFAQWLATQGVDVLRFDFRGIAASRPERLRGFAADFSHWTLDLDAALKLALERTGAGKVSLVGHSIGGFLGPAADNATHLHRLVLVGAQSAYWRDFAWRQRWPMVLMWHGLLPLMTHAVGYFPARALRLGEDLPRGVALQWAARPWRDPWRIDAVARGYARPLPPVHLIAADDDTYATPAALARVAQHLPAAPLQTHRIAAGRNHPQRIAMGHFNLFRSAHAGTVWPRLLELALPQDPVVARGPAVASVS
jgi:predicted alpha/beta hydrolase